MKYYFKTKPMRHQRKALKKFLKRGCGALFAEMGTGKTKIAIDWASALAVKENRMLKVVVLCPKSVLSVWPDELEKHDPFYGLEGVGTEWRIVGVDAAWRPFHYDEIVLWEPDVIIVDESDMIKSPGARRSKGAYLISKYCKYRLVMSGTPIGKNVLDLFAQYKVVDTSLFGTDFGAFKREYALIRAYKVLKPLRQRKMKRIMKPVTFSILKEQCLDLPERRGHAWDQGGVNIVHVDLSRKTQEIYDEMADESVVEFQDLEIMAPIVVTRMLRQSQIASGWLSGGGIYRQIGQEKKMQLQSHLEEMLETDRKKVVIFCRFKHEIRDAAIAAKAAGYKAFLFYGAVSEKNRTRKIKRFHSTEEPTVFIAQWQTGARGIDLTCAAECICYGLTYSLIQYAQGIDRLHRLGQVNKVTYYHYVARNTIDESVVDALVGKKEIAKEIVESPELLYGHRKIRDGLS